MKLNAAQLRTQVPSATMLRQVKKNPIYIILDNVLDTYNVGSLFRLADAVAAQEIFLCGQTETPPNTRIKKASINTWGWVKWSHEETAIIAIKKLKSRVEDLSLLVVEQHSSSIPISNLKPVFPVAVVVGNETYGVSKEAMKIADIIVELPMYGVNKSLNVMVSCGIVLYKIMELLERKNK